MDDAVATAKANDEKRFHRLASAPVLEQLQRHLEHLHRQLEEVEDLGANVDKVEDPGGNVDKVEDLGANVDKVVEDHASQDPGTNVDEKLEGHSSNLLEEVEDHAIALNLADIVQSLNQTMSNIEASQLPTEEARKIFGLITLALAKLDPDEEKNNQHEEKVVNKVKEREHEEKMEKVEAIEVNKVKEEEHEEKVEANLADGLSIFAGWPNFCKILW